MRSTLLIHTKNGNSPIHRIVLGRKLSALLLFSLFTTYTTGCHISDEPPQVPKVPANKEESNRRQVKAETNETQAEKEPATTMRDPFAMPSKLLEQKSSRQEQQIAPRQIQQTLSPNAPPRNQTVSLYAPEPCVAGIFDNGKEKFALLRWQQIQGIFRCGENLGNGYYIKEITANSVLLCPKKDSPGKNSMTLKLK